MTRKDACYHGLAALGGATHFCNYTDNQFNRSGFFGRMFPNLAPLYTDPNLLAETGSRDGPMNAGHSKERTKSVAVGQVFFGQFIDHDITLDTMSRFGRVNVPGEIRNDRTANLDLDCIYGDGPEATPILYHQTGEYAGVKLLTGADGTAIMQDDELRIADHVRTPHGTAVIGDPRNDENRIISQLQLAMIRCHNAAAEVVKVKSGGELEGGELFEATRDVVTRHYHWAILYDFLPTMCGDGVVWDILARGRKYYAPCDKAAYIPVEFSVAAYRFGHSMVPQSIQVQKAKPEIDLFDPAIFGGGFSPLADERAIVDFHELFETPEGREVQRAEKLDLKLAGRLLELPFVAEGGVRSLATRNLIRGQSFLLPAGETLAECMERPAKEIETVSKAVEDLGCSRFGGKSPLWLYILAEAEKIGRMDANDKGEPGEGLGPVGARIVAEVLIGLMELDSHAFLASDRSWTPEDGLGGHVRTVGDLVTYAGPVA